MGRAAIDKYTGEVTIGIDVSAYQGQPNWGRVAQSDIMLVRRTEDGRERVLANHGPPKYVIVRAADGVQTRRHSKPDPEAVRNLQSAVEAGIDLVDVYHFVRAHHPAEAQLELGLEVLRVAGVRIGRIWWDLEGRPDDPSTPDTDESHGAWWHPKDEPKVSTERVLTCIDELVKGARREGYRSGIYTGAAWQWYVANRMLPLVDFDVPEDLWTAYYTSRQPYPALPVAPGDKPWPWAQWKIHQFAGSKKLFGRVAGIEGGIDVNRFRGGEAELRRWWFEEKAAPDAHDPLERAHAGVTEVAEELKATHPAQATRLVDAAEKILR